jgi:hypothetical protein
LEHEISPNIITHINKSLQARQVEET